MKGLADSDSDDEVLNWVAKSRKAEKEKKKAAERAKMLDEMDDEFGVGKIVEEETQRRGGQLLGELDLWKKGLEWVVLHISFSGRAIVNYQ